MGAFDAVIHPGGKAVLIVKQALDHIAITVPCLGDLQKTATFPFPRHSDLRKMLRLPGDGGICLSSIILFKTA